MPRVLTICFLVVSLFAYASACNPRITQAEAIRIAKRQLAKERGAKAPQYFGPYTAKLVDCDWHVVGATPPGDVSGNIVISVNAINSKAQVLPQLRTDPQKIGELKKPH